MKQRRDVDMLVIDLFQAEIDVFSAVGYYAADSENRLTVH